MHGTLPQLSWLADGRIIHFASVSFVPDGGEFPAVGHKLGTFFRACAIDAKDLVVRAGDERVFGLLVRLVAIPSPDPLKADDGGLVVFRQCHIDTATFTIDAAIETDFVARVLCDNMAASRWSRNCRCGDGT
ncbi:hypothetical protein [Bradyrhizobium neotropicale]|uniref:hypothetical protein n=1 Tax=Bradyrhizobium neotropicale TaxID=1497615 RepID=UPI00289A90E5|nr:hypothetical protein [Bradyrhizobium neotropicale]